MRVVLVAVAVATVLAGWVAVAEAACRCACVSNQRQWVCGNSWDVPAGYCGGWCSNALLAPDESTRSAALAALLRLAPATRVAVAPNASLQNTLAEVRK